MNPPFYYVVDRKSGFTKAAQTTAASALKYLKPDRLLVGPLLPTELPHVLNALGIKKP